MNPADLIAQRERLAAALAAVPELDLTRPLAWEQKLPLMRASGLDLHTFDLRLGEIRKERGVVIRRGGLRPGGERGRPGHKSTLEPLLTPFDGDPFERLAEAAASLEGR